MPDNINIIVNGSRTFSGRLIGFIDSQDCRAVINTADAARKISTERTMTREEMPNVLSKKRFVLVTADYSAGPEKDIFISPKIRYAYHLGNDFREVVCEGGNVYKLEFI